MIYYVAINKILFWEKKKNPRIPECQDRLECHISSELKDLLWEENKKLLFLSLYI